MPTSREISKLIHVKLEEVSRSFEESFVATGMSCPKECGNCCFYPDIHCSAEELLPMAYYLYDQGLADQVLAQLEVKKTDRCIFLKVVDEDSGKGYCSQYLYRPYICRAFGLFARKNRHQQLEMNACPKLENRREVLRSELEKLTVIDEGKTQVLSVMSVMGQNEWPINQAMKVALETVLFKESYVE